MAFTTGWLRCKRQTLSPAKRFSGAGRLRGCGRTRAGLGSSQRLRVATAMLGAGMATLCHADPAVHVGFGRDYSHGINKYEIGVRWHSGYAWGNPQGWQTNLYWEVDLARWDARSGSPRRNVTEFGPSPVIRLQKRGGAVEPFFEASVGFRLMSHTSTSPSHDYSTAFRFSETLGFGLAFGRHQAGEVGLRFQHVSNAGIKTPNPGSDFITGYLGYRF
ncbi:lipid A 3-O-deacylase PagL [Cupriavidus gilardii J11]|uniref:Lipid A 3-O-deacylase PagL n=1 Tax=Cupriavidus gilardii J11 TaxID=936133 RepID=A0A562BKY6_9BURK|nr:acyloxyacyl hydrolase [Cupriavidus gilardii]TWG85623.1 lipid A 3-O-deacylase PagL [Cupriavidus gilardii J11]